MCGPSDIACRYGGDEYILFLQNIGDREELTARIEGFRKKIHDKAEEKGYKEVKATHLEDYQELFNRVSLGKEEWKRYLRNRVNKRGRK